MKRSISLDQEQVLEGHTAAVRVVKFNRDGRYCMSGGYDKKIILWNPYQSKSICTYTGHSYQVLDLDITSDHLHFVSCGGDKQPFLWDVAARLVIRKFRGHNSQINCVAFHPSASIFVTGSNDQTVKCWDCRSRSIDPIQVLPEARDSVTCVATSTIEIFTTSADGCLRTYDVRMGKLQTDCLACVISSVSLSNDGQILLLSTLSNKLMLIDKEEGTLYHEYRGHTNTEFRVDSTFLNNSSFVASGSENGDICVWALEDTELLLKKKAHQKLLMGLAAHPYGKHLLTASEDQTIKLWTLST
ncbi:WD repeat domain-containing protein 83-like [Schistocerca gregaria]|uniref:WD repeat domain-containing protein 83-like n=1 Tax=Schistocerca gregaria TaxID=7010 RepID=UPI00211E29EE|nr:WD repeat domain-containing protein 83-like [Schistocerca gregaria]